MRSFNNFSKSHNTIELLKVIAAMQLLPTNHTKNVRLENLARIALVNQNDSATLISLQELKNILDKEFPKSKEEDPLVNLFTENINFIQGNYVVFPGTTISASSILNNLLKTIFYIVEDKKLPEEFTRKIYSAAFLMLCISDNIAKQCNFTRNHSVKIKDRFLELPTTERFETLSNAVIFSHEWLLEHCKIWNTLPEIVDEFLIDPKDPGLLDEDCVDSPLQFRPILKNENEYVIVQPTTLIRALIHFIWKEAEKFNYKLDLLKIMNDTVWREASLFILNMMWLPTDIKLPSPKSGLRCKEEVYFIDLDKYVYVCFIDSGYYQQVSTQDDIEASKEIMMHGDLIQNRQTEVIDFLRKKFKDHEFLTLFIVSEVGYSQGYALPSTEKNYLSLLFTSTELKHIANLEEPDSLLLWKFAKAYLEIASSCEIINLDGTLNAFAVYSENDNSFWPRGEERPNLLCFMPGMCCNYVKASILKVDLHSALYLEDGKMHYRPVYSYCDYAPFYAIIGDRLRTSIYLKGFIAPIWFLNDQKETHHEKQIHSQLEMLAFWLNQMKSLIDDSFTLVTGEKPIMVYVHLDSRFKREMRADEIPFVPLESVSIPIEVNDSVIEVTIPLELAYWFATPDNKVERKILSSFLNAILISKIEDKKQRIQEIIDIEMPVGPAKMASMLGANNLLMESRNVPGFRPLSKHEVSNIQVNVTRSFKVKVDPGHFSNPQSKSKLAYNIATALYNYLIPKLQDYDAVSLVPILLNYNEACVQEHAIQPLDLPTRLACLRYDPILLKKLFIKGQDRTKAALAVRCLIEFIVAGDVTIGKKLPNLNDIDELIALMYEIIEWARLSDTINMGLDDPEMKLLPCGRVDVDFSSMNKVMAPVALTRSQIEIDHHKKEFKHLFTPQDFSNVDPNHPEALEINEAFKKEWGISFSGISNFIMDLVHFTRSKNGSTLATEKDMLYEIMHSEPYNWKDEDITAALDVLCLVSGWKSGAPPDGYDKTDTYPWRYNRALSFIRRPIVRFVKNNTTYYMWSYRHLLGAFENLKALLTQGILWSPEGGPISAIIKKMNFKKGKSFRKETYDWFTSNSGFEVISYEVPIEPGAKLNAEENLGDIDVMAIDHSKKIIYSIECKNTAESKTPVEFALEINKYLGSSDKLAKHVRRDEWLKNNLSQLNAFVKDAETYSIRSVVITAFVLPMKYLKKNELSLPFISLPELKMENINSLEKLYEEK